ncbi:hypothetical protein A8924_6791 [Saccharopolyspora erythraea NRRL 2338]|uniref:Uncharacterized protein n=2 Tax=Saccharopolyspora erythraea TaxID=1836 RepID=A4FNI6_SACEN|nr:Rv3235 family protein [Saccharopolyspora erythraea]EQD81603.1 hypothetical protein N599_35220 [Saccharopolyspora erythraea D]PFG99249.1 hypothetical protein A8924_6791 [Saccharopolyspora erythraea NRRL 2338]QRK89194.1 hypothetical protein JQX30_32255 [Saccharopolyspora erythraea]CAM05611.1 hypothetical protein SACE_6441 [Saccharopolyspora erythraea NRRL 2338]
MTAVLAPAGAEVTERTACALARSAGEQILDVLAGRRSVPQLRRHLSSPVAALLLALLPRWYAEGPDYRLRSVHASLTDDHTVEACLIVGTTSRVRALVMRLEQEEARWVCTVLSLL